jgi:single-strand DNA-binding protein
MKYGVNGVTLVGNVGEVPKVSERDGEAFVANFSLATNEFYKNKEEEEVSKTEWHRIVYMSGTLFHNLFKGNVKLSSL